MSRHSIWVLFEIISLVTLGSIWRAALSATAIATITVHIVEPTRGVDGLMLSTRDLDLQGRYHEELTIMNRSSHQRELLVELMPLSETSVECNLRHSPRSSTLPPGGHQVVRLILQNRFEGPCKLDHELLISDAREPGVPLFHVPVYNNQNFVGEKKQNHE